MGRGFDPLTGYQIINTMDKLEEMWNKQHQFNARILGPEFEKILHEHAGEWLLKYATALNQEVSELIDCVPWKWWAHYQKLDLEHAKVELIDILHFVLSIAQVLGMSPEDIFNTYMQKNAVNFKRQDDGYLEKAKETQLND